MYRTEREGDYHVIYSPNDTRVASCTGQDAAEGIVRDLNNRQDNSRMKALLHEAYENRPLNAKPLAMWFEEWRERVGDVLGKQPESTDPT